MTLLCSYCDNNIEFLCLNLRPSYLPREFTNIFAVILYVNPTRHKEKATVHLRNLAEELKTKALNSLVIITGDFNDLRDLIIPHLFQFVHCPSRGSNILDFFYCNIKCAHRYFSKPPLGLSNYMLLLLSKYKSTVKQCEPLKKTADLGCV